MKEFKIRASAAGKLATNARSKTETLSETTKSYLEEWLKEQIYGVKKQISSKYLEKGLLLEDSAIEKVTEWLDMPFMIKNESGFENDYFTGTPDLFCNDTVIDIKVSWDCFTFPLFDTEIPTKDYFYQLQVYMHLTGKTKAKLIYVLLNTPEFMTYEAVYDYSETDTKYKTKVFEIEYDYSVIEMLQNKVIESRKYINSIFNG